MDINNYSYTPHFPAGYLAGYSYEVKHESKKD